MLLIHDEWDKWEELGIFSDTIVDTYPEDQFHDETERTAFIRQLRGTGGATRREKAEYNQRLDALVQHYLIEQQGGRVTWMR